MSVLKLLPLLCIAEIRLPCQNQLKCTRTRTADPIILLTTWHFINTLPRAVIFFACITVHEQTTAIVVPSMHEPAAGLSFASGTDKPVTIQAVFQVDCVQGHRRIVCRCFVHVRVYSRQIMPTKCNHRLTIKLQVVFTEFKNYLNEINIEYKM